MTRTLAIVSLCLTFFVGVYARVTQKIIGGTTASISEIPYIVSLRSYDNHFCGGAIISERHILTAAHCLDYGSITPPYNNIFVVSGSSLSSGTGGKFHRVIHAEKHQNFIGMADGNHHDVAVLTLMDRIIFDANQRKIDLPTVNVRFNARATVSGWGASIFPSNRPSPVLKKVEMPIISISACMASHAVGIVHNENVCVQQRAGVGVCYGDSGGPLVANNKIIGIASWAIPCALGGPEVYTNVYLYKQWIRNAMARY